MMKKLAGHKVEEFDLKEWRKEKKLTQAKVANHLGVTQARVAAIESGRRKMPARWHRVLQKI
ncbi:MAG: helix-turn-helix transcriptional regulator [Deltaproteobacteria bacterium]|nr:helix-turn-helix transcriptional regulator [Deltaproteobacteria bacterium]MBW2081609.1 helix-turn-helix transcriptional regulator [Deltaproteobacteria bacterium]